MSPDELQSELSFFRERSKAPAVAAAIVSAEGIAASGVTGTRRRSGSAPATLDDCWHIGSCTKSMTAVLYACLVEHGKAAWGTQLHELFSDIEDSVDTSWRACTMSDVLRCRGGIKANLSPLQMRHSWVDDTPLEEQRTRVARQLLQKRGKPVGKFLYSNLGYIIAGAAIDRLAGMPYEQALHHHVLEPLGIYSVGYGAPANLCGHHARLRLGGLLAFPGKTADPAQAHSDNPAVLSSAGTLHLTVQDWARFVRIFVSDGANILKPAALKQLLDVPDGKGTPMAMGWVANPSSTITSYFFQGSNTLWSTTMMLSRDQDRISLVACNDGRTSVLMKSAVFAERLLDRQWRSAN